MEKYKKPSKNSFKNGAGDKIKNLMECIQSVKDLEAATPITTAISLKENQNNNSPANEVLKNKDLRHFVLGAMLDTWGVKIVK